MNPILVCACSTSHARSFCLCRLARVASKCLAVNQALFALSNVGEASLLADVAHLATVRLAHLAREFVAPIEVRRYGARNSQSLASNSYFTRSVRGWRRRFPQLAEVWDETT